MTINYSSSQPPLNGDVEDDSTFYESDKISQPQPVSTPKGKFSPLSSLQTMVAFAFLLATLFTLFSPDNLFSGQMFTRMFEAWQAGPSLAVPVDGQPVANEANRIGIVSGHWKSDSGAVCQDGLAEAEVNLTIATLVQKKLTDEGFTVDLLQEFDPRLSQYQAIALISIHADTCDYINDLATGFKVAAAQETAYPDKANRLTSCLVDRYAKQTGLAYKNTTTNDMTAYHAFGEVNTETTAVIIETGFLNLDRQILTGNPDAIAQGIVDGILCFIRNESLSPTVQPTPQTTP